LTIGGGEPQGNKVKRQIQIANLGRIKKKNRRKALRHLDWLGIKYCSITLEGGKKKPL